MAVPPIIVMVAMRHAAGVGDRRTGDRAGDAANDSADGSPDGGAGDDARAGAAHALLTRGAGAKAGGE